MDLAPGKLFGRVASRRMSSYALSEGITPALRVDYSVHAMHRLDEDTLAISRGGSITILAPASATSDVERVPNAAITRFAGTPREAWAFSFDGRCHRRARFGTWVEWTHPDLPVAEPMAAWAGAGRIELLYDDGSRIEGRRTSG